VVLEELNEVIDTVNNNSDIRSAIITGAGAKAFVAGADIGEFLDLTHTEGMDLSRKGQYIFSKIENASKPVVAAVNGFALGGGCELAMACHFRIASDNAKFGQPEVSLGLIPGYGGTQRLPMLIGKGRALELLMSGAMLDAATALQYGLVNYVVPQTELLAKTRSVLELINSRAPIAIDGCIRAVNALYSGNNGYPEEVEIFGECFATEDMKEGTTAFLEKRKASFKGK